MMSGRVKLQLSAFALLSGGVAANLFFLQPPTRAPGYAARGSYDESRLAQVQPAAFGDPGLITGSNRTNWRGEPVASQGAAPARPTATKIAIPKEQSEVTRAVQRELRLRGYEPGASDGEPTLMTRAAIMGFEHDHGMRLTGNPSQALLKAILMGGGRAKPVGSRGQSAEAEAVIRSVQGSLANLGYKPGAVSGRLTPDTARAIREFEVDQALPESGRVSGPLIARLAGLGGDGRIASGR
jgi:hypothetical protein